MAESRTLYVQLNLLGVALWVLASLALAQVNGSLATAINLATAFVCVVAAKNTDSRAWHIAFLGALIYCIGAAIHVLALMVWR